MIYSVYFEETVKRRVQVEADNEGQAVDRALDLGYSSASCVGVKTEYNGIFEHLSFDGEPKTHEEGWEYIA